MLLNNNTSLVSWFPRTLMYWDVVQTSVPPWMLQVYCGSKSKHSVTLVRCLVALLCTSAWLIIMDPLMTSSLALITKVMVNLTKLQIPSMKAFTDVGHCQLIFLRPVITNQRLIAPEVSV